MFRIKICGITSVDDGLMVARAGANAIGLNFYPRSPRYISFDLAREIVAALPKGIVKVGLFVNVPPADVCRAYSDLPLDLIQLHGDEPPEYLTQLGNRPVMRAFRVRPGNFHPVVEYLARCRGLKVEPRLALLDSLVPGEFGGTGQPVDSEHGAAVRRPVRATAAGSGRRANAGECRRRDCGGSADSS